VQIRKSNDSKESFEVYFRLARDFLGFIATLARAASGLNANLSGSLAHLGSFRLDFGIWLDCPLIAYGSQIEKGTQRKKNYLGGGVSFCEKGGLPSSSSAAKEGLVQFSTVTINSCKADL
jgi:hypothetical protein